MKELGEVRTAGIIPAEFGLAGVAIAHPILVKVGEKLFVENVQLGKEFSGARESRRSCE